MTARDHFSNAISAMRYLRELGYEHLSGSAWRMNDRSAIVHEGDDVDAPCVVYFHYDR